MIALLQFIIAGICLRRIAAPAYYIYADSDAHYTCEIPEEYVGL